jgi:hypothetical protein
MPIATSSHNNNGFHMVTAIVNACKFPKSHNLRSQLR